MRYVVKFTTVHATRDQSIKIQPKKMSTSIEMPKNAATPCVIGYDNNRCLNWHT